MSRIFTLICGNEDADQLCSNCTADLHLCFRYTDNSNNLLKSEISSFYPSFVAAQTGFVSDLVGDPEDRFSSVMAQIICYIQ